MMLQSKHTQELLPELDSMCVIGFPQTEQFLGSLDLSQLSLRSIKTLSLLSPISHTFFSTSNLLMRSRFWWTRTARDVIAVVARAKFAAFLFQIPFFTHSLQSGREETNVSLLPIPSSNVCLPYDKCFVISQGKQE